MTQQMQACLVSTIIPVFNRPEMIVESVQSVLNQNYRPIEIIIVDDGSTDQTPHVLKCLMETHPEIQVITQQNAGPGVAREAGRQRARGEFIQYHDSDDLLSENKFTQQVAALLANSQADVVYGKTECRILDEPLKDAALKGVALKGTGQQRHAIFPAALRARWWSTSTPLYRRRITDKAGAWITTTNEEDWEYDCRIASMGARLAYVNEFVSITRMHDNHLHFGGTHQPQKLIDRCQARIAIADHAKQYMQLSDRPTDILADDWLYFSKSVFLLARQCALAGLQDQAKTMLSLSIAVINQATIQQRLFKWLVFVSGWTNAAKLVRLIGK